MKTRRPRRRGIKRFISDDGSGGLWNMIGGGYLWRDYHLHHRRKRGSRSDVMGRGQMQKIESKVS